MNQSINHMNFGQEDVDCNVKAWFFLVDDFPQAFVDGGGKYDSVAVKQNNLSHGILQDNIKKHELVITRFKNCSDLISGA